MLPVVAFANVILVAVKKTGIALIPQTTAHTAQVVSKKTMTMND